VREAQLHDRMLQEVHKRIEAGSPREFTMEEDETIFFRGRLCVPQKSEVKMDILREATVLLIWYIQESLRCMKT
jgi:hypothetical protein